MLEKVSDSHLCDVTIWSGTIVVKAENLKSCGHNEDERVAAAAIMKRLNRLAEFAGEAMTVAMLIDLSRRPVTALSDTEDYLLTTLEERLGLPKLESLAPSDETNNGITEARRVIIG